MNISLSQDQAPLWEEILRYINKPPAPFHTPGHKAGRNWETGWRQLGILANLDLTEVSALNWAGALSQAEMLAAHLHRADYSFFLVQGASQGILGGIMGAFLPGDTVLISRNCHASVMNAVILADLNPVFLENEFHYELGIPIAVRVESLISALKQHPHAKGVIITNPTYQGISTRIGLYRELIGERMLIVDEAHGGHLGWSGYDGFDAHHEADIWVHGTHKIFGSMTQTGMLHLRYAKIDAERVKNSLRLITTTSPSYILLASLDSNRRWLALSGTCLFRERAAMVFDLKKKLSKLGGMVILEDGFPSGSSQTVDPWKLTISFANLGITGFQAETFLQQRYRIQPEYAGLEQLTFFIAPWQEEDDLKRLYDALQDLTGVRGVARECARNRAGLKNLRIPASIPPLVIRPREAVFRTRETWPLADSIGRISTSIISPYPPGIPLIGPGELIREEEVAYLTALLEEGGMVHGINSEREISVVKF